MHKGAVGSHHLRGQWRLPDHHRELEEGGAGRVHQGAVRPRHHLREPQGLPDHHRDMTEGEGGRVVTEGPPEGAHHHREQTEGGAGRGASGATEDPPDGVQDLEKISKVKVKGINILP